MKIGIPKEIKPNENRVAITPSGVMEFTKNGHIVYIQDGAGVNSDFSNEIYTKAGATILPTIEEVLIPATFGLLTTVVVASPKFVKA